MMVYVMIRHRFHGMEKAQFENLGELVKMAIFDA